MTEKSSTSSVSGRARIVSDDAPPPPNPNKAKAIKQRGEDPLRQALYRMSGVDLTTIDAVGVETVNVILSEYGADLSRFPTEKQFVAHVRLAPYTPDQWRQTRPETQKTRQRQRPRRRGVAHGGALVAPQSDGARGVLPADRAARRGRRRRVCDRAQARPIRVSSAALGPALRRRGRGGV